MIQAKTEQDIVVADRRTTAAEEEDLLSKDYMVSSKN